MSGSDRIAEFPCSETVTAIHVHAIVNSIYFAYADMYMLKLVLHCLHRLDRHLLWLFGTCIHVHVDCMWCTHPSVKACIDRIHYYSLM